MADFNHQETSHTPYYNIADKRVIKCFIFDLDGTLIDSSQAHADAWKKAFQIFGGDASEEKIMSYFGLTTQEIATHLFPHIDAADHPAILAKKTQFFLEFTEKIKEFPGASDLLKELCAFNIPIYFASNNPTDILEILLHSLGWDNYSSGSYGLDPDTPAKPDPTMLQRILDVTGLEPEEAVMIGDSVYDMEAAFAINMKKIAILSQNNEDLLKKWSPELMLEQIGDLRYLLPLKL